MKLQENLHERSMDYHQLEEFTRIEKELKDESFMAKQLPSVRCCQMFVYSSLISSKKKKIWNLISNMEYLCNQE